MFTSLIVRPIFNLLVVVYSLLPGHDFGLSIILFTLILRLLMWPLVKKQMHQAKAMRELQPEMKRIKQASKGDRQKEAMMMRELYKEREISPFGSLGTLVIQLLILIGLYSGLKRIVFTPKSLITFSYSWVRHFSWMKVVAGNIHQFHNSFFGIIDLSLAALNKGGGIYWPAMIIVAASAISQYFLGKQLMPAPDKSRTLRAILKEAGQGKQADQSEVNAAVGRSTRYFLPVLIFILIVNYPSALSLYWLAGGIIAYIQQAIALREDVAEMEATVDNLPSKDLKAIPEAEVVKSQPKPKKKSSQKRGKRKGRR